MANCPKCDAELVKVPGTEIFFCTLCRSNFDAAVIEERERQRAGELVREHLPAAFSVFVQRREELANIWAAWQETVTQQRPTIVVLLGEPGVGKTAVLERFYRELASNPSWDPDDYWPDIPPGRLEQVSTEGKLFAIAKKEERKPRYLWLASRCDLVATGSTAPEDSSRAHAVELSPWLQMVQGLRHHPIKDFVPDDFGRRLRQRLRSEGAELLMDILGEGLEVLVSASGLGALLALGKATVKIGAAMRRGGRSSQPEEMAGLARTVTGLLVELSNVERGGMPLVLSIDDLQWTDQESIDLLLHFLEAAADRPVMVLATCRNIDVVAENRPAGRLLSQLARREGSRYSHHKIEVERLDDQSIGEIVQGLFGPTADVELVKWIAERAEGIPIVADYLARFLVDQEFVDATGRFRREVEIDTLTESWRTGAIPHDARGIITERLERLREQNDRQYRLLQCGAVEGRTFRDRFLERVAQRFAALSDLDLPSIQGQLQDAERKHHLIAAEAARLMPAGRPEQPYLFTHQLIYDAFLEGLPPAIRTLCLETIIELFDEDEEFYAVSGKAEALRNTAERRRAGLVAWQALVADRPLTDAENLRAAEAAGKNAAVALRLGSRDAAIRYLETALHFIEQIGGATAEGRDVVRLHASLLNRLANRKRETGDLAAALDLGRQALEMREQLWLVDPDNAEVVEWLASSLNDCSQNDRRVGDLAQSRNCLERGAELMESLPADVRQGRDFALLEARLRQNLASLLNTQGEFERALKTARLSRGILADIVDTNPGDFELADMLATVDHFLGVLERQAGETTAAERSFEAAIAARTRLVEMDDADLRVLFRLSMTYRSMAWLHRNAGRGVQARDAIERTLEIRRRLADIDTSDLGYAGALAQCINDTAVFAKDRGALGEAIDLFEESLRLARYCAEKNPTDTGPHWTLSTILFNLASVRVQQAQVGEAVRLLRDCLAIRKTLCETSSTNRDFRRDAATAASRLSGLLRQQGQWEEAGTYLETALDWHQQILDENPRHEAVRSWLAVDYFNLGNVAQHLRDMAEAEQCFRKGMALREEVLVHQPTGVDAQWSYATALNRQADFFLSQGEESHAGEYRRRAVAGLAWLTAQNPNRQELLQDLSIGYRNIALAHRRRGEFTAALAFLESAVALQRRLVALDEANQQAHINLAVLLSDSGITAFDRGDLDAAADFYRENIDLYERLRGDDSTYLLLHRNFANACESMAFVARGLGRLEEALEWVRRSSDAWEQSFGSDRDSVGTRARRALNAKTLAGFLWSAGRFEEALVEAEKAVAINEELMAAEPEQESHARRLASAYNSRAGLLTLLGRMQEAGSWFRRTIELHTTAMANPESADNLWLRANYGVGLHNLGLVHLFLAEWDDATVHLAAAIEVREQMLAYAESQRRHRFFLAGSHAAMALARRGRGSFDAALREARTAVSVLDPIEKKLSDPQEQARSLMTQFVLALCEIDAGDRDTGLHRIRETWPQWTVVPEWVRGVDRLYRFVIDEVHRVAGDDLPDS
ncbi:MAG: tetratricopeptide repeat protein [Candidatus Lernaella stagnicola]|nr:tetratricopeptide repeat protein [Candidatus Lernaella stagnicola]